MGRGGNRNREQLIHKPLLLTITTIFICTTIVRYHTYTLTYLTLVNEYFKCFSQLNIYSIWVTNILICRDWGTRTQDDLSADRTVPSFTVSLNVIDRWSNNQFPYLWTFDSRLPWESIPGVEEKNWLSVFWLTCFNHIHACQRQLLSKFEQTKIKLQITYSVCCVGVWAILTKIIPTGLSSIHQDAFS